MKKLCSLWAFSSLCLLSACGDKPRPVDQAEAKPDNPAGEQKQAEEEKEKAGEPEDADPKERPPDPAAAMKELRNHMLTTPPGDFGIEPSDEFPTVYGVVMEFPISDSKVTASVVSLSDGNASLYTTSTFGVIGGYAHEKVRLAAKKFVTAVAEAHDEATPTTEVPYPENDQVRFYLLTFSGLRYLEDSLASIESERSELSELFWSGQEVLTQLRLISERPGDDAE